MAFTMTIYPVLTRHIVSHCLFLISLLQAIDAVTCLAFCWQFVSQAPQHFRLSETQATSLVTVASAANLSAVHLPLPAKQAKGMTDGIKDTRTANQQVRQTEIGRDVVPTTQRNSPNSNQHSVVTTKLTHGRGPSITGYRLACNIKPTTLRREAEWPMMFYLQPMCSAIQLRTHAALRLSVSTMDDLIL